MPPKRSDKTPRRTKRIDGKTTEAIERQLLDLTVWWGGIDPVSPARAVEEAIDRAWRAPAKASRPLPPLPVTRDWDRDRELALRITAESDTRLAELIERWGAETRTQAVEEAIRRAWKAEAKMREKGGG